MFPSWIRVLGVSFCWQKDHSGLDVQTEIHIQIHYDTFSFSIGVATLELFALCFAGARRSIREGQLGFGMT